MCVLYSLVCARCGTPKAGESLNNHENSCRGPNQHPNPEEYQTVKQDDTESCKCADLVVTLLCEILALRELFRDWKYNA
jgi:hypothetical protein